MNLADPDLKDHSHEQEWMGSLGQIQEDPHFLQLYTCETIVETNNGANKHNSHSYCYGTSTEILLFWISETELRSTYRN